MATKLVITVYGSYWDTYDEIYGWLRENAHQFWIERELSHREIRIDFNCDNDAVLFLLSVDRSECSIKRAR